ncbi:hypothetical protein RvY_12703 [Ramazzottius varieornatus]|uniref:ribonuclease H n=1 Tax=Ramazzottius varieornatus TaxID=947166 RepID=A0A1D1VQU7_RAMVA|nr:hypothetical protein RvY_12703 [Ramazzottius varieornatus]
MPFYAVKVGKKPGVYKTWAECQQQTVSFTGAQFKKFDTAQEAEEFVNKGAAVKNLAASNAAASSKPAKTAPAPSVQVKRPATELTETVPEKKTEKKPKFAPPGLVGKTAVVYIDAVCYVKGRCGVGVFWGEDSPRNISEQLLIEGTPTMNRVAVHAAARALRQAKELGVESITINTPNSFVVQSMTQWASKWLQNGWKTTKGKPVTNAADLQELAQEADGLDIEWVLGPKGGDASRLANEGARNV